MSKKFQKFLFADLDDTLFQTREKCGADQVLETAAFLPDGSPNSYTTAAQRAFLAFAQDGMTLIPTTARNRDQFRRVCLPFSSYAVLNFGGVVLDPGGAVDGGWLEAMRPAMEAALPDLRRLARLLDGHAESTGFTGRTRLVEDCGLPFYVVLKDPGKVAARLDPFESDIVRPWLAANPGYALHRNGNALAVLPAALDKANAVAYITDRLRREHGDIITFGMGDSRTDARFMAACDYAIVPRRSQLAGLALEAL